MEKSTINIKQIRQKACSKLEIYQMIQLEANVYSNPLQKFTTNTSQNYFQEKRRRPCYIVYLHNMQRGIS